MVAASLRASAVPARARATVAASRTANAATARVTVEASRKVSAVPRAASPAATVVRAVVAGRTVAARPRWPDLNSRPRYSSSPPLRG